MTLGQILRELAQITGRKAPTVELPYFVAWMAGVITTALRASDRHSAARAARSRAHGEEEDVGIAREGRAGAGIFAAAPHRARSRMRSSGSPRKSMR